MKGIVDKVAEVIKVDAASLYLIDASSGQLVIQAASGYQKDLMKADPLPSYRVGDGVTGRIAESNKPFQADSLNQLRSQGQSLWGQWDQLQGYKRPEAFMACHSMYQTAKRPSAC